MTMDNNHISDVEVTFTADWSTISNQQIQPGCALHINYHKQRLLPGNNSSVSEQSDIKPASDGDFYVELVFHINARPVMKRLTANDYSPAIASTVVNVPVYCREVTLWVKCVLPDGDCRYDSKDGANYVFPVCGNAVMLFPYGGEVQNKGHITPGGTLKILYDSQRLPGRDYYLGQAAWDIQAVVVFSDCGGETRKVMKATNEDVNPIMICDFDVPEDANFVSIWFKHWGHFSGDSCDTNWGRNYVRSFEYDGEIWFTEQMGVSKKGFILNGRKVCVLYDTNRIFHGDADEDNRTIKATRKLLKIHAAFGDVVMERNFGEVRSDCRVKTVLDIPKNATEVKLWFSYADLENEKSCFDSNFGQNYHFEVSC